MTMVLAFAVATLTGFLFSAALGARSFFGLALSTYVITSALIVLEIEILSAFRAVTEGKVLGAEALVLMVAALTLRAAKKPARLRFPRSVVTVARGEPLVAVLLAVVVAAMGYELALALLTPPNNWDSLSYHLSRAAAWYQHGGVSYVQSHTERENANPDNAEILVLYTFLFAHDDSLRGLLAMARPVCVDARDLRGRPTCRFDGRPGALRQPALRMSRAGCASIRHDPERSARRIVPRDVAAFLAGAEAPRLPLAALAFGLAVGTKFTAVYAVPALVPIAASLLARRQRAPLILYCCVAVGVLGSLAYVLNLVHTGSLLGAASATRGLHRHSLAGFARTVGGVLIDVVLDFRLAPGLRRDEDSSYFGLLGFALVLPVIVLTVRRWAHGHASRLEVSLAAALPLYLLTLAAANTYNQFLGRFLITPVALTAPLFATVLKYRRYAAVVGAVAMQTLATSLLFDHAKPSGFFGTTSIWGMTRAEAQSVQRPAMRPVLEALDRRVPPNARVGYVLGSDDWDYPLYGRRLTRRLVKLDPHRAFGEATSAGLEWQLVRQRLVGPAPPGWQVQRFQASRLALLQRRT